MVPLLKLFGFEEGNGISPFADNIKTLWYLVRLVDKLFRPSRRDTRGTNKISRTSNLRDNEVDDVEMEELDGALVYEDKEDSPSLALPNSA